MAKGRLPNREEVRDEREKNPQTRTRINYPTHRAGL
jgi:hypothetical protein